MKKIYLASFLGLFFISQLTAANTRQGIGICVEEGSLNVDINYYSLEKDELAPLVATLSKKLKMDISRVFVNSGCHEVNADYDYNVYVSAQSHMLYHADGSNLGEFNCEARVTVTHRRSQVGEKFVAHGYASGQWGGVPERACTRALRNVGRKASRIIRGMEKSF